MPHTDGQFKSKIRITLKSSALAFFILTVICSAVLAESISLRPIADTTLSQAFPDNNLGAQSYFNSGTTQTFTTNRALMKFNVATAIPRGSKITSVTLLVAMVKQPVDGLTPSNFLLHRILRDWNEGAGSGDPPTLGRTALTNEATWSARFAFTTNLWATAGGGVGIDYATNVSGDTYAYGTALSPYTFESAAGMVADVQLWLNQPATNFGWLLRTEDEPLDFTARGFASREDTNRAPVLTIEYSPPQIQSFAVSNGVAIMRFHVEPGWTNVVQYSQSMAAPDWQTLTNISPLTEETEMVVTVSAPANGRFFRLLLP